MASCLTAAPVASARANPRWQCFGGKQRSSKLKVLQRAAGPLGARPSSPVPAGGIAGGTDGLQRPGLPRASRLRRAPISSATTSAPAPTAGGGDTLKSQFDWANQWYPVHFIDDLDPSRPEQVTVLGRAYVLWQDGAGEWRCFVDLCPHRLAPLSEGYIDNGNLECAYHGWEFGGDGKCKTIPQAPEDTVATVTSSPRACATPVPVSVRQGIMWIFPGDPSRAPDVPLATVDSLDDPAFKENYAMRDLSYGYDTLLENVLDPSHVPIAHHGIQGKREKAAPMALRCEPPQLARMEGSMEGRPFTMEFVPPCLACYTFNLPPKKNKDGSVKEGPANKGHLVAYCVPTRPGESRILARFPRNFFTALLKLKPRWYDHLERNAILDGDMVFLHAQERSLREEGRRGKGWKNAFYLPCDSDAWVIGFRKWFDEFGGGEVGWAPGVSPSLPPKELSREKVLDRFHTHTEKCGACRGAYRNLRALTSACLAAAAALAMA
eukprot:CAMPEP_0182866418 /NCGR_PEP_ID=MMETSP0034_2-20130328/8194_1 /TAXON_ID=156128 /ORGANISM="Nephroselmis pyriformis, Strain CCMP717" /LENGTH=492 /DNA_ID=CAMNT_0024998745 /DNA_START=41 /DNA_END=1515 /DNA_ORIENTATION=-